MSGEGSAPADDWDQHWERYAGAVEVNPAQAYRRELVLAALALKSAEKPCRVLEIGCGTGDLSRDLVSRHPALELLGIDRSETGLRIARSKVPSGVFLRRDLTEPATVPEPYRRWATHAVCTEVLEHLEAPQVLLANAREYLAPGGALVVTVPAGPMSAFDRHIGHRRHFTTAELRSLLESAGFEVTRVSGAGFPFFNLYRLMVVARGQKLIGDVRGNGPLPLGARLAMRAFSWLFALNSEQSARGWQLVATAVEPRGSR